MARIPSIGDAPHLAGVFKAFPDSIRPLLEYHDKILRDPSPLSVAERELIAAYVSGLNACSFCFGAHSIIAEAAGIDAAVFDQLMKDIDSADVDDRLKPIFKYVKTLTLEPSKCQDAQAQAIRDAGWTDEVIFTAVSVCALFNFMNRLVEGMGVEGSEAVRADQRRRNTHIEEHRYLDFAKQLGIENSLKSVDASANVSEQVHGIDEINAGTNIFGLVFNQQFQYMAILSIDGKILQLNRLFLEFNNLNSDECIGNYFWELPAWKDLPDWKKIIKSRVEEAGGMDGPLLCIDEAQNKDGSHCYIRAIYHAMQSKDGEKRFILAQARDITDYKKVEDDLKASELKFRTIVEDQEEFIVRWRPGGLITFVNDSFCRYHNLNQEDAIGANFFPFIHVDERAVVQDRIKQLNKEHPVSSGEHRVLLADGSVGWNNWTDRAICDDEGNIVEYQSVGRDITEKKMSEQQLHAAYLEIQNLKERIEAENTYLREELRSTNLHGDIVGQSEVMKTLMHQVEHVAVTDSTVLILGETGTGKELLARAIHRMSKRAEKPLIIVNCAAMPEALVESELFGREKGAYTGALSKQIGYFEAADGGTIFLDELGELPLGTQVKLLRVLQDGTFERLGGPETKKVDVRIVAATNRDLDKAVEQGRFRQDLLFRLNVFPITVPPLRERRDDIESLTWTFVNELATKMGKIIESISKADLRKLQNYPWPGNIRELRNVIERAMISATGPDLRIVMPDRDKRSSSASISLDDVQRQHIVAILERVNWRIRGDGGAAELLQLNPTTLESRMKKLGIKKNK